MVAAQRRLGAHLGIDRLLAVAGGSMGGMPGPCAGRRIVRTPSPAGPHPPPPARRRLRRSPSTRSAARRIYGRPALRKGDYYAGSPPDAGLAVARMVGHITYLSEEVHAGEVRPQAPRQGRLSASTSAPTSRSKATSATRATPSPAASTPTATSTSPKAIDYFDLTIGARSLAAALARARAAFLILSFSSDWLYPTALSRELLPPSPFNGHDASFCELDCPGGHDAFLLEHERMAP